MARLRRGRYEGQTFLPMLTASELADRYRPYSAKERVPPERAAARLRGEEEHARFDRDVRRHMPRSTAWRDD